MVFNNNTFFSQKIGVGNGLRERSQLPLGIGILLVVISFVNSCGFIEALSILEETPELECDDAIGPLTAPPQMVDFSLRRRHQSGRGFHHQMLNYSSRKASLPRLANV